MKNVLYYMYLIPYKETSLDKLDQTFNVNQKFTSKF